MQTKLIRIGNSQGVRIPKAVIEQACLGEDLDIEVRGGTVIIRPVHRLRDGWAEAAIACHEAVDGVLTDWHAAVGDGWS